MAASLTIEEERGTYVRFPRQHPHNGYYAGDFSRVEAGRATLPSTFEGRPS